MLDLGRFLFGFSGGAFALLAPASSCKKQKLIGTNKNYQRSPSFALFGFSNMSCCKKTFLAVDES